MYLKQFREHLGFTQRELSNILNIAQTSIARYENNKIKPTSTILKLYVDKLSANPYYLFIGKGPVLLEQQEQINLSHEILCKELELNELKKRQFESQ